MSWAWGSLLDGRRIWLLQQPSSIVVPCVLRRPRPVQTWPMGALLRGHESYALLPLVPVHLSLGVSQPIQNRMPWGGRPSRAQPGIDSIQATLELSPETLVKSGVRVVNAAQLRHCVNQSPTSTPKTEVPNQHGGAEINIKTCCRQGYLSFPLDDERTPPKQTAGEERPDRERCAPYDAKPIPTANPSHPGGVDQHFATPPLKAHHCC